MLSRAGPDKNQVTNMGLGSRGMSNVDRHCDPITHLIAHNLLNTDMILKYILKPPVVEVILL